MYTRQVRGFLLLGSCGWGTILVLLVRKLEAVALQVKTDRRHGVALLAGVCLVAIIVLTIAQASIGHWFVYSGMPSKLSELEPGLACRHSLLCVLSDHMHTQESCSIEVPPCTCGKGGVQYNLLHGHHHPVTCAVHLSLLEKPATIS